jgi:hypothetical protein
MVSNSRILANAIRNKQQIRAVYEGFYREMCPYAMGWKGSKYQVLCFQFGGESSQPLPPDGQWQCMEVNRLTEVMVVEGPWYRGPGRTLPADSFDPGGIDVKAIN